MQKNQNKNITINTNTSVKPGAPRLILNANDKIYLATAVKSVDKLTFIYTLACMRCDGNRYEINPTTELAAFDNVRDAAVYHKTINEIMAYQQKMVGPQKIKELLSAEIAQFTENLR